MTDHVTLNLPGGKEKRTYQCGDRVVILDGYLQCPEGGSGTIHVFLGGTAVVVKLDDGTLVPNVSVDSIFLKPAEEAASAA